MSARTPTAIDAIAEDHIATMFAHDPVLATAYGSAEYDERMPALDPDWYAERSRQRRAVLARLERETPVDYEDRVTAAELRRSIGASESLRELGLDDAELNNIESPVQHLRMVFDLMPTETERDWARVSARLAALPAAMSGYVESLRHAAARGQVAAARQVRECVQQARNTTGAEGFFATLQARAHCRDDLPAALRDDLARDSRAAADAYAGLADYLTNDLQGLSADHDAVGREVHAACSRFHLGAEVDPEATYAWGLDESARIATAMGRTAERISSGASVAEAVALLDADPARTVHGEDALREWMQRTSDEALHALADVHFDIPEPIRRLECRIAPTRDGGIYYTSPSEDLTSRPGRMWWSVPSGVTTFQTWKARTIIYHEGVPGHHLQIAQTVYRRELLNRWRRVTLCNGYCEGWGLYAEQLMAELGFLDDPADLLGMLDAQSLRAARVVIDFGVHCGLPAPAEVGGGSWDHDKAWTFLRNHSRTDDETLRFELTRYFGWPGQASSYSLGQRLWLQLRDDLRASEGDGFDQIAFHRRALDLGAVGLDVLQAAMLGEFD